MCWPVVMTTRLGSLSIPVPIPRAASARRRDVEGGDAGSCLRPGRTRGGRGWPVAYRDVVEVVADPDLLGVVLRLAGLLALALLGRGGRGR